MPVCQFCPSLLHAYMLWRRLQQQQQQQQQKLPSSINPANNPFFFLATWPQPTTFRDGCNPPYRYTHTPFSAAALSLFPTHTREKKKEKAYSLHCGWGWDGGTRHACRIGPINMLKTLFCRWVGNESECAKKKEQQKSVSVKVQQVSPSFLSLFLELGKKERAE